MKANSEIHVTKTFLPPLEEYEKYLEKIWSNAQLTNQGPLLREFEVKTKKYLDVENFQFIANGTLALQVALKALGITKGEIITTPFSYVATTSAILWERCRPVFVDIDPETLCIDPAKIEAAITKNTKAIMPVHVFGNPCDTEAIEKIAKKHNLKTIYDGAHAFGVKYKGKSLLSYGDISICSFHATKPFHTIEGGCVISKDKEVNDKVTLIKKFGHYGDEHSMLGINAKASEFQAAMGICNLRYIEGVIKKRGKIIDAYNNLLGSLFEKPKLRPDTKYNNSYYPILFKDERNLEKAIEKLGQENIFPRRYFYPSLNTLPYIENIQSCSISENVANRIICLPLYSELELNYVKSISKILKNA